MVFTFLMQREAASFFFLRTRGICWRLVTRERRGYFAPLPSFVSPCLRSPHAFLELAWLSPRLRWPRNAKENAAFPAGWFKSFHCLQTHSLLLVKSYKLKHLFYLWTGSYSCRVIFEPWTDVHSERRPRGRICWIGSCVRGRDESGRTG